MISIRSLLAKQTTVCFMHKHEQIMKNLLKEEHIRSALLSKDVSLFYTLTKTNAQAAVLFQRQVLMHSLKNGCEGCSKCCEMCNVDLSFYDVERLASYLRMTQEEFTSKFCIKAPYDQLYFFRIRQKPCPFLNENKCSVYEARPTKCVLYPFISDLQNEKIGQYEKQGKTVVVTPTWCKAGNTVQEMLQKINEKLAGLTEQQRSQLSEYVKENDILPK
jgi:Fe-S-cluster containining protein